MAHYLRQLAGYVYGLRVSRVMGVHKKSAPRRWGRQVSRILTPSLGRGATGNSQGSLIGPMKPFPAQVWESWAGCLTGSSPSKYGLGSGWRRAIINTEY